MRFSFNGILPRRLLLVGNGQAVGQRASKAICPVSHALQSGGMCLADSYFGSCWQTGLCLASCKTQYLDMLRMPSQCKFCMQ